MIELFKQADINLSDCFFSNAFMGLRKTKLTMGKFPGFKDEEFTQRNIEILDFQIEKIKPKIIITLGKYAPVMLANLYENDLIKWKSAKTFKEMNDGIKVNVKFGSHKCTCVPLVHPCMRNSNVKHRHYKDYLGNDAEIMMLKDALNI